MRVNTNTLMWELMGTVMWVNTTTLTWVLIGKVTWVNTYKLTWELNVQTGLDGTGCTGWTGHPLNLLIHLSK